MTETEYQQAINWLFVQAPNYQIDGEKAYKPGLQNITQLCSFFGNPQDKIKTIHIGGTNGKGSTSNMLASILQEAGYKIGLYNSPHLIRFTERIKVNGKEADREYVYQFIQKLKQLPKEIQPSFFEFTTIMAFEYFRQQNVDYAIIEVGLGGRLDSTNIIQPIVSAITNIALDHQNILGNTLEEIAAEKAGIIKKHTPIISGVEEQSIKKIIQDKANSLDAPFIDATTIDYELESDLMGNYQQKNGKVVIGLAEVLRKKGLAISDENIANGLLHVQQNTGFVGRWFEFSKEPLIICDTAHNQQGLQMVFDQLHDLPQHKHIILGFVAEKKIDEVLEILPVNSTFYFAKPSVNRGRDPHDYEDLLQKSKINYKIFKNINAAYLAAKQNLKKGEIIFIGGSNFVVGEFLEKNLQE